ncbi:hypothetical protein EDC01DRAFT_612066 [Geopyxis carbonaria]|nr:hypothetical protein EDC01DRAFT_612066 [Geopyxis carbonaria]
MIGDCISNLPLELAFYIFEMLDLEDLFTCSAVSTSWRMMLQSDYLYVPHLIRKYDLITHGRNPIKTKANTKIAKQILQKYSQISATTYFNDATTLRELALRDVQLNHQWKSGVPTRKTDLNACLVHRYSVEHVVVDSRYRLVISGDRCGKIVFWSTETGISQPVRVYETTHPPAAISAMALNEDHLAIGTWGLEQMVRIFRRDPEDTPIRSRAFSEVGEFHVPSPVVSMIFEGNVCIAGCYDGEVMFFDIGVPDNDSDSYNPKDLLLVQVPRQTSNENEQDTDVGQQNFSLHYQKPFLFTSSSVIEQSSPKRKDRDNKRDLWEYDDVVVKTYMPEAPSEPDHEGRPCIIHPIGNSELLVAWPDTSIYRMGNFKAGMVQLPVCDELVDANNHRGAPVGALAANDMYFVTSTSSSPHVGFITHINPLTLTNEQKITLFSQDGKVINQSFQQSIGDPSCVNDLKVCIYRWN